MEPHPRRTVIDWAFRSAKAYENPFADVRVEAHLTGPDGATLIQPMFFDGGGTWRLRFNPALAGEWRGRVVSRPHDPDLAETFAFSVAARACRGFLKSTPGVSWGFSFENGEVPFILGDTVYDLFGMQFCGGDVTDFLRRRKAQGFNLFRTRLQVSPFHPPSGDSEWQTRRMWPWGGSPQAPRFDIFNLEWFRNVDQVVADAEALELGLELIMEAWGFEFPFNHRSWFTPEWEELWLRYLIARYDAYGCVWFWTPLNEYEYYPNGDWNWTRTADRWAMRISRWIKETAAHGHVVAAHNGPPMPPFAERFKADPEAIDAILFQFWGDRSAAGGWLGTGIDDQLRLSLAGWTGSALLAEWGYERNPSFALKLPLHAHCDRSHTRRGAWRGACSGFGLIHGFENSWGPWMELGSDQAGVSDLAVLARFFREKVPFADLRPAPHLVRGEFAPGHRPLALASADGAVAVMYLPAGGRAEIAATGSAEWFDPRSGTFAPAADGDGPFDAPAGADERGNPLDAVLVVRA